jgi:hypothetical protein
LHCYEFLLLRSSSSSLFDDRESETTDTAGHKRSLSYSIVVCLSLWRKTSFKQSMTSTIMMNGCNSIHRYQTSSFPFKLSKPADYMSWFVFWRKHNVVVTFHVWKDWAEDSSQGIFQFSLSHIL